jgi:hypothetical protein
MIPDLDIWRAALLMVKRYGDDAMLEAAARADQLQEDGDWQGRAHLASDPGRDRAAAGEGAGGRGEGALDRCGYRNVQDVAVTSSGGRRIFRSCLACAL